jgi:AcrR family transcriptional regulator
VTELLSRPLRERKRAETWTTIHNAAAELTLEMGLHVVTVEAIADQSNIASRTFFNYFNSKEDAILGLQQPVIADEVRNDFVITEDLLSRVSTLLLTVAQSTFGGDYATSRRFEVLERYPELIQRRIDYIAKVEELVAALVEERLEESGQWRDELADIPCGETARVIVMMASAAMRFAMQRGSPPIGTAAQFEALDGATTLFRRILRKAV